MKLNTIANRTFWLMLAWLVVAMPADGFYDPSLGRWINRDPIGERGGLNLYAYVRNNPLRWMDRHGLEGWGSVPDMSIPPDETAMGCAEKIANEVGRIPGTRNDPSSRYHHCLASCRISRECPGGRFTAWLAGDWFQDPWWKGPDDGSDPGDRAANKIGRNAACNKEKSCEEQCKDALDNGSFYPPPPPPSPPEPPVFPIF